MADQAADILMDILSGWGADVVFGAPGEGDELSEALRAGGGVRYIEARTAEGAAFMACGYAKYTGRLGVCLATSAQRSLQLLNGLYDAKLDGQPVLALTTTADEPLLRAYGRRELDLGRVFQDVALYNERVEDPGALGAMAEAACRAALERRTVSHLGLPLASLRAGAGGLEGRRGRGARDDARPTHRTALPTEQALRDAARVLNAGKRVAILAGRGALGATDEIEALADKLAAPVVKPLLGKAALPDDSPYNAGGIGLLGTRPGQEAIEGCDTLFLVGTAFPYIEYLPRPGEVQAVQLDIDPARIGLRCPVAAGLVGDCRQTLQRLLPLLQRKQDRGFLEKAQAGMTEWWQTMIERGTNRQTPMRPQVVAWELGNLLSEDAIVTADSGTIATWFARQIRARRGQKYSLSGMLATMANGLPYTVAAQVAFPERQCVAFVGDGGFSMLMAELATAVRYRLPIKVVVVKNNVLGQIKWEQMVMLGNPEYGVELQPMDFVRYAESCGARGVSISDPAACRDALAAALATQGPVVIEAVVDPFTPPMPAKIKPKQALHFAESLARGQPCASEIALTIAGDKLREMI